MFGNASANAQSRTRRAAEYATTNGGIGASDAFDEGGAESAEAIEKRALTERLVRVQRGLCAIKEKRALVDIQRQLAAGSENKRQTRSHRELRADLVREAQEIQGRLSQINPILRQQRIRVANKQQHDFGRTFMEVAKRMLAEPVYERILTATLHYVGETGEPQAHD